MGTRDGRDFQVQQREGFDIGSVGGDFFIVCVV